MTRFSAAIALLAVPVCAVLAVSAAAHPAAAPFNCPKDATETDTQKWVRNYDGHRGSVWCNDGATATVTVSVGPSPLVFKGGVCTSSSQGKFVSIGTIVSYKRKAGDPPYFQALKWVKSTGTPEHGSFARNGEFAWGDETPVKWNGLSGTWSGEDTWVADHKVTVIKASAKFACKRIIKTPF